jgi:outer membrane protein TolC
LQLAEWNVAILVQDLKQELVHLYYSYQKSLAEHRILKSNQDRAEALVSLAQLRVRTGTATVLEQTRAEVRATDFKRAQIDAELAATEALTQIKFLLGMPMDAPLVLEAQAFQRLQQHLVLPQWFDSLQAVESLPEWRHQMEAVRRARIVARAATFKNLPTIEAFADWGYDSDQAFDGTASNGWMVGLSASIPLYEGGKLFAERKEAKAALAENLARLEQIEKGLQRTLYLADYVLEQRFQQIAIANQALELGQAEVSQAEDEYQQGLVDNRALIDAQQGLADAELVQLDAVYNFALSRLALARSLGRVERVLE